MQAGSVDGGKVLISEVIGNDGNDPFFSAEVQSELAPSLACEEGPAHAHFTSAQRAAHANQAGFHGSSRSDAGRKNDGHTENTPQILSRELLSDNLFIPFLPSVKCNK